MTTVFEAQVTCAVCSHAQDVLHLGSTSAHGAMDLDSRPPPPARQALAYQVQRCVACGYVAYDLGRAFRSAREVVVSAAYQEDLVRAERIELARNFTCLATLELARHRRAQAGWARVFAAWACDDADDVADAMRHRVAALEHFIAVRARGGSIGADTPQAEPVLLADLARRAGCFDLALDLCRRRVEDPFLASLLDFERRLSEAGDRDCYRVDEVEGERRRCYLMQ